MSKWAVEIWNLEMVTLKKLFLASWFAGSSTLLPDFVSEDLTNKKVVFIPTAGGYEMPDEDRAGLDFFNEKDKEALEQLGMVVEVLEVSTASFKEVKKSIVNADCLFVCGGSTFFLMQELKRKGADNLIVQHIEQGKLYMGTSAGSLLLQKQIVVADVETHDFAPELKGDCSGLGYLDFCMYVHYGGNFWGNDDESIAKYYSGLNCQTLADNQAVTVKGDQVEIVTAPENSVPSLEVE